MTGWDKFTDGMSADDIIDALKSVPLDITHFIKTKVKPVIQSQKKIQAIKVLRDESDLSLKLAKQIVDELSTGASLSTIRFGNSKMIDDIETAEQAVKRAIRKAANDSKTAAALLGVRDQLADLWTESVELPLPPKEPYAWENSK